MSFAQARVLSFESRRATEMAELIRINGGHPFVAPALVEVPLEHNEEAFAFAERLRAGEFNMMIFLTGVGARLLDQVLSTRNPPENFRRELRKLAIVARGPKPIAVLREWSVPVTVAVPEPNTWRELLEAIRERPERSVAVQEYGRRSGELLDGLAAQGRMYCAIPVYQWKFPDDTAPLAEALDRLLAGQFDVAIFTTAVQVDHLLEFAEKQGKRAAVVPALKRLFVASIGPTCSEALRDMGIEPALEPSHPKMGILVRETGFAYAQKAS